MERRKMTDAVPADALAAEFFRVLREWLTPEELAEINRRNSTPEYSESCASHDFCDPNQAMADALAAFGMEFDPSMCEYIYHAWTIARNSGFGEIPLQSSSN